jgi:hypothetical protein
VLFFPDGVVGTIQKLLARLGGMKASARAPASPDRGTVEVTPR